MSIPNKQIGWSNESNLLWNISKQLERLIQVSATKTASVYSYSIKYSDRFNDPCSASIITVYSTSTTFGRGMLLYTDSTLTTLLSYGKIAYQINGLWNQYSMDGIGLLGSIGSLCAFQTSYQRWQGGPNGCSGAFSNNGAFYSNVPLAIGVQLYTSSTLDPSSPFLATNGVKLPNNNNACLFTDANGVVTSL